MPIFARRKIVIEQYCMGPPGSPYITLKYNGPNPQNIYEQMKKLFNIIFKLEEGELEEKDFSWDRSGAKEEFSVKFELVKDLDKHSYFRILMSLKGEAKPSKEFGKEGSASIFIDARVVTEYPQDTIWQRSLFYELFRSFYHKVIYEDTREAYRRECREAINRFNHELKSFLNLLPLHG